MMASSRPAKSAAAPFVDADTAEQTSPDTLMSSLERLDTDFMGETIHEFMRPNALPVRPALEIALDAELSPCAMRPSSRSVRSRISGSIRIR